MTATRMPTASATSAAMCALSFITPSNTNRVTSGSEAKIALANNDPPTGSRTCLYISTPPSVPCRLVPGLRCALFITCFNDTLFPATGQAVVTLLERLGHWVVFPEEQTCGGQMHGNSGYDSLGRSLVDRWERVFSSESVVVSPSASCV